MFNGRTGRMGFLGYQVLAVVLIFWGVVIGSIVDIDNGGGSALLGLSIILGSVIWAALTSLSACVKRLHDLDQSGWWVLLGFVPFVGTVLFLVCLFIPGNQGQHDYEGVRISPNIAPNAHRSSGSQQLCAGSGLVRASSPRAGQAMCPSCSGLASLSNGRILTHRLSVGIG